MFEDKVGISGVGDYGQEVSISAPAVFGGIYKVEGQRRRLGKHFEAHPSGKKKRDLNDDYPAGIIGFSYSSLNSLGVKTVIDDIVSTKRVDNVFSICLRDVGGMLSIGGSGNWSIGQEIVYTPVIKEQFYNIEVTDVLVAGKSIGISSHTYTSGECIVDCGTPFATVPTAAWQSLKKSFLSLCSLTNLVGICNVTSNATLFEQNCFNISQEQVSLFPNVTFVMRGMSGDTTEVSYSPQYYLKQQYFCGYGLKGLGFDKEDGFTIIGATMLQMYTTVFDRKNSRIGFSKITNCA